MEKKDLRDIVKGQPLLRIVETTIGMNGYPQCLKDAIVGFDNFKQAEELAEKHNLRITTLHKRDGWHLWERNSNTTYEPFKPTAEWYGENYDVYKGEDVAGYFVNEVKPTLAAILEDTGDWYVLERFFESKKKIIEQIECACDNELIVTCDGEYFDTIDAKCMEWSFDTHNYIVALVDDEE